MTFEIEFTHEADEDLDAVLAYTYQEFGEKQLQVYYDLIQKSLKKLSENPLIGHFRKDVPLAYRSLLIGQHIFIYFLDEELGLITIIRILHSKMNFLGRF